MADSQNRIIKRPYGFISGYLFANFGIMGVAGVLVAILLYSEGTMSAANRDKAFVGLVIGIPCLIIAALLMLYVSRKAKRSGYGDVAGEFIAYSILLFAKVLAVLSIVLIIPLFKFIFSPWEEMVVTDSFGGRKKVALRSIGSGRYEDASGNVYEEN